MFHDRSRGRTFSLVLTTAVPRVAGNIRMAGELFHSNEIVTSDTHAPHDAKHT